MARLLLLATLAVVVAGCSDSLPGGKVVNLTRKTVIGAVTAPWTGGNAAAGKAVFVSADCGACHIFTAAHATGTVGPDLDKLASYAKHANRGPLPEYAYWAIVTPPAPYVPPGYPPEGMPTTFGQSLSAKQLVDLVAFLSRRP